MVARWELAGENGLQGVADGLVRALIAVITVAALVAAPAHASAAEPEVGCPATPYAHVPEATQPLNLGELKLQFFDYKCFGDYDREVARVLAAAQAYVQQRAKEVKKPALVLDIDETSLSNWMNIKADDFGFIKGGTCDRLPDGPCGFDEWILKFMAPAIKPALNLFNAATAKGVAVFFITGRVDRERQATLWNLDRAGYEGWAKLITRPDNDTRPSIQPFKAEERSKIAAAGYTIIANVGDQQSDLDGGFAECPFKVPNPFYFIP